MSLRQRTGSSAPAVFTSADLLISENLSSLDRVCQYTSASMPLMRSVHVSMISDVAHEVGYEVMVDRLIPLLPKLCDDGEWVVRNKVAPEIATMCQLSIALGAGKGYDLVVSQLLPLLAKLAGDVHADVRASGARALAMVSIMLKPDDLAVHLFTIVIELSSAESSSSSATGVFGSLADSENDTAEDLRIAATELMELLAPHLGEELCEQFLVPTIQNLAEDDSFRVRKAVALHLSDIIKTCVSEVREEKLIPMFLMLASDGKRLHDGVISWIIFYYGFESLFIFFLSIFY
jgi:serine/threonine-protein phosphatase 4 regulatory subunit 1